MSNFLNGHLVGFEAMPDLEGAIPSSFEEEYTDIYGTELIPQRVGDGAESYDRDIEKQQKARARKITSWKVPPDLLVPQTIYER